MAELIRSERSLMFLRSCTLAVCSVSWGSGEDVVDCVLGGPFGKRKS